MKIWKQIGDCESFRHEPSVDLNYSDSWPTGQQRSRISQAEQCQHRDIWWVQNVQVVQKGLLSIDFWIWNFNFMKLYTFKMKYRYKILQITSNSDFILKDLFVFDIKIYSIMLSQKRINIYINVFKWEAFEYFFSKYSVCTLYIFHNLEST